MKRPYPPAPPPSQEWGTPTEACGLLRCSRASLYRRPVAIAPYTQLPHGRRYHLASIRRWLSLNLETR